MNEIVYISDPKIITIPIQECNESMIDLKEQDEILYEQPPKSISKTNKLIASCYTKIRTTVFDKLRRAQKDLPEGWSFRLYEGYRSRKLQQIEFEQIYQKLAAQHLNLSHHEIFHKTTALVSPVTNLDGTPNIPPHNTGGAIDIEVVEDGQLVDMGMAVQDWATVEPELCATDCSLISKQAQDNRNILREILCSHGFVNYPTEWWHFSYGDRYWAYLTGAKHAIYGSADKRIKA